MIKNYTSLLLIVFSFSSSFCFAQANKKDVGLSDVECEALLRRFPSPTQINGFDKSKSLYGTMYASPILENSFFLEVDMALKPFDSFYKKKFGKGFRISREQFFVAVLKENAIQALSLSNKKFREAIKSMNLLDFTDATALSLDLLLLKAGNWMDGVSLSRTLDILVDHKIPPEVEPKQKDYSLKLRNLLEIDAEIKRTVAEQVEKDIQDKIRIEDVIHRFLKPDIYSKGTTRDRFYDKMDDLDVEIFSINEKSLDRGIDVLTGKEDKRFPKKKAILTFKNNNLLPRSVLFSKIKNSKKGASWLVDLGTSANGVEHWVEVPESWIHSHLESIEIITR